MPLSCSYEKREGQDDIDSTLSVLSCSIPLSTSHFIPHHAALQCAGIENGLRLAASSSPSLHPIYNPIRNYKTPSKPQNIKDKTCTTSNTSFQTSKTPTARSNPTQPQQPHQPAFSPTAQPTQPTSPTIHQPSPPNTSSGHWASTHNFSTWTHQPSSTDAEQQFYRFYPTHHPFSTPWTAIRTSTAPSGSPQQS